MELLLTFSIREQLCNDLAGLLASAKSFLKSSCWVKWVQLQKAADCGLHFSLGHRKGPLRTAVKMFQFSQMVQNQST